MCGGWIFEEDIPGDDDVSTVAGGVGDANRQPVGKDCRLSCLIVDPGTWRAAGTHANSDSKDEHCLIIDGGDLW